MPATEASITEPRAHSAGRSKLREILELTIGYGLILAVIWTPRSQQRPFYILATMFIVVATWLSFRSFDAMGLRLNNLLRSSWVVAAALAIAAMIVLVSAKFRSLHPIGGPLVFVERYWGYAVWALIQQLLLQDFFLRRLLNLTPGRKAVAVVATSLIFAVAHLPNPVLTPVTFLWALIACAIFLRYRNIFPLAISHAILGVTLATAIPAPLIRNMRVGRGYITYPATHRHHHRSQADQTVSTQAWVSADAPTRRS